MNCVILLLTSSNEEEEDEEATIVRSPRPRVHFSVGADFVKKLRVPLGAFELMLERIAGDIQNLTNQTSAPFRQQRCTIRHRCQLARQWSSLGSWQIPNTGRITLLQGGQYWNSYCHCHHWTMTITNLSLVHWKMCDE